MALPHLAAKWPEMATWLNSPIALVVIAWITSLLLVAELPLIAFKFKNSSLTDNSYRYGLLVIGAVCLIWLQLAGIPLVILTYLLLSGMENLLHKK